MIYDVDISKIFERKMYICCINIFRCKYGFFEYYIMWVVICFNLILYVIFMFGLKVRVIRNLFEKFLLNYNYFFF